VPFPAWPDPDAPPVPQLEELPLPLLEPEPEDPEPEDPEPLPQVPSAEGACSPWPAWPGRVPRPASAPWPASVSPPWLVGAGGRATDLVGLPAGGGAVPLLGAPDPVGAPAEDVGGGVVPPLYQLASSSPKHCPTGTAGLIVRFRLLVIGVGILTNEVLGFEVRDDGWDEGVGGSLIGVVVQRNAASSSEVALVPVNGELDIAKGILGPILSVDIDLDDLVVQAL
jgi:hypothetical protein